MGKAAFQGWFNKYIWDSRGSLEDPNTPINGLTVAEILGSSGKTQSGEAINTEKALTFAAVHRANRLLCDIMSYLPVNVIENNSNGTKAIATSHPAQFLLHNEPNELMTSFTWREAMQANLNFQGNGYSEVIFNGAAEPMRFDFHQAWNVEPKKKGRDLAYKVTEDGQSRPVLKENMIHIPGFGFNGFKGMATIDIARESFASAIAGQNYGSRFFGNDATPGGILVNQGATEEQMKLAKASWQKAQGGRNRGKVAVMPGQWEYKQTTIPPEQAQFLQTRQFSVIEIARWFGIPPHLLFDLDRATFSNIEHQGIEFLVYTLNGWVKRWEQELNRKLFSRQDKINNRFFVKFNTNAILQTDIKSRSDFYRTMWSLGAFSTNQILDLEDMNKVPGGDQRFVQQGFMPLDKVDKVLFQDKIKVKSNGSN